MPLPILKYGTFLAGTATAAPFFGFLAIRASLFLTSKMTFSKIKNPKFHPRPALAQNPGVQIVLPGVQKHTEIDHAPRTRLMRS